MTLLGAQRTTITHTIILFHRGTSEPVQRTETIKAGALIPEIAQLALQDLLESEFSAPTCSQYHDRYKTSTGALDLSGTPRD